MLKNTNGRLDQYGAGPFEQQKFGTVGIEKVNGYSPNRSTRRRH